jgi:hypothetical protein
MQTRDLHEACSKKRFASFLFHVGFLFGLLNMENFSSETYVYFQWIVYRYVPGGIHLYNYCCGILNPVEKCNFRLMEEALWDFWSRLEDTIVIDLKYKTRLRIGLMFFRICSSFGNLSIWQWNFRAQKGQNVA